MTDISPGRRVIPLSSYHLTVQRFRVPVPPAESSDGSVRRGEILERAWRAINTGVIDDTNEGGLEGGCAVIDGRGDEVILWVFSLGSSLPEFDTTGLEEMERKSTEINKMINCSAHKHEFACLGYDRKCDVKWIQNEEEMGWWKMLSRALVEKKAWEEGRRVYSSNEDKRYALHPLSTGKLLLVVKGEERGSVTKATDTTRGQLPVVRLAPIDKTAIQVADFDPTPIQLSTLEKDFKLALGSRMIPVSDEAMDIDSHLGFGRASWGVYWVCDIPSSATVDNVKGKQGIMTIWPNHLAHPVHDTQQSLDNITRPTPILQATTFPAANDLLDVATGVFDFLSAYNPPVEPEHAEITPETDDPDAFEPDMEERSATIFSPASPKKSEGGSDLDDLFGDESPVPEALDVSQAPVVERAPQDPAAPGAMFDLNQSFDGDIVMSSPPGDDLGEIPMTSNNNRSMGLRMDEEGEGALVTEDDFDFFDSPADRRLSAPDTSALEGWVQEQIPDGAAVNDQELANDTIGDQLVPEPKEKSHSPPEQTLQDAGIPSPADTPQGGSTDLEKAIEAGLPTSEAGPIRVVESEQPVSVAPAPKKTVTFESPPSSTSEEEAVTPPDLVPSPFGPLVIDSSVPSFAYSFPSPAASPETLPIAPLRADLVARLKGKTSNERLDYAADWELESEPSEMETEEDYTGAPPTPVSFIDSDTQPSVLPSPKPDSRREDVELAWDGSILLGSEWVGMRWNENQGEDAGSAKVWKDSWAKGRIMMPPTPEPEDVKLIGVEAGRLVEEIVSNRSLRNILLESASGSLSKVYDGGASNSMDSSEGTSLTNLPPCQIQVGYAGNICQLAISALRYWRQLGLQPVGGKKNITAFVICGSDAGEIRVAKDFLSRMRQTWQAFEMGKQLQGESAAAKEGIIAIPSAGLVDTLTGLLPTVEPNTVIYVLLPVLPAQMTAQLVSKLLAPSLAGSETITIKLLPPSAIDMHQAQEIALEVYDRIQRPLQSVTLRGMPTDPLIPFMRYPAFALAPEPIKPALTLAWPLRSYDAMNRWRMVHCAYTIDPVSKRVVAFALDAEGEGWSSKVIEMGEKGLAKAMSDLWEFFKDFGGKASVEYRLAICRLGSVASTEIGAWRVLSDRSGIPLSFVILDVPDPSQPSPFSPPHSFNSIPPSLFGDAATRIVDESLTGRTRLIPRLPMLLSDKPIPIIPSSSFLLDVPTSTLSGNETSTYHIIHHKAPPERDENPAELFAEQYHRLFALGRMRYGLEDSILPVHAEFVRLGVQSLDLLG